MINVRSHNRLYYLDLVEEPGEELACYANGQTGESLSLWGRKVTHKLKTRPDRWEGQQGSCTRDNRPYLSYQKIRWADYHRKNPSKGSTGHITHKQFAKQVASEWNQLEKKSQNLHSVAKAIDKADRQVDKMNICSKCGRNQSELSSAKSFAYMDIVMPIGLDKRMIEDQPQDMFSL